MKTRIVTGSAAALIAIAMLGCSSARVEPPAAVVRNDIQPIGVAGRVFTPSELQSLQVLPPAPPYPEFKACKLGQSCMALDERPFENCLVSTKRCADKIKEPLLVEGPLVTPGESGVTISH